jgi:hypothetical protein
MLGEGPVQVPLPPAKKRKMKTSNSSNSNNSKVPVDPPRIQAYLQSACSALGFDIGEIWCCNDGGAATGLQFVQLYTSPAYAVYRSKLVTPSDNGGLDDHGDVSKHIFR